MPLRQELISASVPLPLPHFSWKEAATAPVSLVENGLSVSGDCSNSLRRNSQQEQFQDVSDLPSTDSEIEQNESVDEASGHGRGTDGSGVVSSSSRENVRRRRGGGGSPEAWSTNSDSPTPTNSVAERPWAQDTLWHGLLGDEHRQLLGTEEESSDRHSSDDEENENELVTLYQITPEQREYYNKQFKAVQRDPHGLLSGQAARVFFEKSRIPVEELRHIWQLCDVTRDGALSLSEFTAAMHLVVLRRNNIPLPTSLPHCLHPNVLQVGVTGGSGVGSSSATSQPQEPPEADLLHLNDDEEDDHTDNTIIAGNLSGGSSSSKPRQNVPGDKNIMNQSNISTSSQASNSSRREATPSMNRSISNSPNVEKIASGTISTTGNAVEPASQWTKFSESPTSSVAPVQSSVGEQAAPAAAPIVTSPGLKPALFDMKRSAQDVVSNPQILHPVPLRVTPIGTATAASTEPSNDNESVVILREDSPKAITSTVVTSQSSGGNVPSSHRDSNDLRAIQRPQAKKLPAKNSALPPPPQREASIGSSGPSEPPEQQTVYGAPKKEPPPLPPPRPHRHARSSSLDLNKFKVVTTGGAQQEADEQQLHSLPPVAPPPQAAPPTRITLQQTRVSAFEVYRKPQSPPQQPPPRAPTTVGTVLPSAESFEKRVTAISDSLRHVTFTKGQGSTTELLQKLREQNNSLLHLCNDLSDELLSVQTRKEEMRLKLEGLTGSDTPGRTSSTNSGPVTANVTGGPDW
nr:ralBP1-associated Eps domain-containing protein 1 isoform X1 [Drosophila bipectinata]